MLFGEAQYHTSKIEDWYGDIIHMYDLPPGTLIRFYRHTYQEESLLESSSLLKASVILDGDREIIFNAS